MAIGGVLFDIDASDSRLGQPRMSTSPMAPTSWYRSYQDGCGHEAAAL